MNPQLLDELNKLRSELSLQKEQITDIKALAGREIDRDFHTDLWELSPRELDNEMGARLTFLNDDIDIKKDLNVITSHRRLLGKPIRFIKKTIIRLIDFYISPLVERQTRFNDQVVAFLLAGFIRTRTNEKQLEELKQKITTLEEDQEMMLEKLEHLTK